MMRPDEAHSLALVVFLTLFAFGRLAGEQSVRLGGFAVPEASPWWWLAVAAVGLLLAPSSPGRPRTAHLALAALALAVLYWPMSSFRAKSFHPGLNARVFSLSQARNRPEAVGILDSLVLKDLAQVNRWIGRRHDLALEVTGDLVVPRTGVHRFTTDSDDRSFLHIDGRRVLQGSGTAVVELDEGVHRFRFRYEQVGGPGYFSLVWRQPALIEPFPLEHYLFTDGGSPDAVVAEARRRTRQAGVALLLAAAWWFAASCWIGFLGRTLGSLRSSLEAGRTTSRWWRLTRPVWLVGFLVSQIVLYSIIIEYIASRHVSLPRGDTVQHFRLNHVWPPYSIRVRNRSEFPEPYEHHYNRQGWLETYDVALEKPPGTYRIFYVGDSFTAGTVPMEQSVPSLVEEQLRRRFSGSEYEIEVINTGTTSYSPIIYYVLVRYFLSSYSPDLIVLNVDMTDDFDDWKYRKAAILDSNGNPWAVPPRDIRDGIYIDTQAGYQRMTWLTQLTLFLYENSYTYNYLRARNPWSPPRDEQLQEPEDAGLYRRWSWCRHEWDDTTEENVRYTLSLVKKIAEYCRSRHIKVLLTGVPHYQQFVRDKTGRTLWSDRPHREIERIASETGVAYLDSYGALAPAIEGTEESQYYYRTDMHFNTRGYRLWSEAHVQALTDPELALIPSASEPQPN